LVEMLGACSGIRHQPSMPSRLEATVITAPLSASSTRSRASRKIIDKNSRRPGFGPKRNNQYRGKDRLLAASALFFDSSFMSGITCIVAEAGTTWSMVGGYAMKDAMRAHPGLRDALEIAIRGCCSQSSAVRRAFATTIINAVQGYQKQQQQLAQQQEQREAEQDMEEQDEEQHSDEEGHGDNEGIETRSSGRAKVRLGHWNQHGRPAWKACRHAHMHMHTCTFCTAWSILGRILHMLMCMEHSKAHLAMD
jgi:hypothetical protein